MVKFLALAEEASAFRTAGTSWLYFKLLNESINTTREDFYPETSDYWTVSSRAEGYFRTSGSFDTLIDPVVWPKLLALFMGDGTPVSTELVIENCEDAWTAALNVTCSAVADKSAILPVPPGTNSAKQQIGVDFTTGVVAYEDFAPVDISTYSHVQFWIKHSGGCASGELQLLLDNTSACVSPLETLTIPALTAATWTRVKLPFTTPSALTAIISVGLSAVSDPGAVDVYIDDVRVMAETTHTFKFGADEEYNVGSTGVKPFTTRIGVGIEKDRQITGCLMESLSFEAVAREVASSSVGIIGSGNESLIATQTTANVEAGWALYTQPYLTFASASTMTIATVDRLALDPTIEAFRLTLTRGWDADAYTLGTRFLGNAVMSGMASVEGSMDFSFTSEDELERFLAAVDSYQAGNQTPAAIVLTLRGPAIIGSTYYSITITIPIAYYTASTESVSGRDRVVQTVDFRGIYDSSSDCACQIVVVNATSDYILLE